MSPPTVTRSGRCSRCLAYVDSVAGCTRCWARTRSDAATAVLATDDIVVPELVTAFIFEEQIPAFPPVRRGA